MGHWSLLADSILVVSVVVIIFPFAARAYTRQVIFLPLGMFGLIWFGTATYNLLHSLGAV